MARKFPLFLDISDKKIVVYGAGRIASRRVETLLAFTSSLTVFAPEASEPVQESVERRKALLQSGGICAGQHSGGCFYGTGSD